MLVSTKNFGLVELHVISLLNRSGRQAFGPLIRKLRSLGVDGDTELDAVLNCIKVRAGIHRGEDIIAPGRSPRHSTVLIDGVACLYERLHDGTRQMPETGVTIPSGPEAPTRSPR